MKLYWHFYETRDGLPGFRQFRAYAAERNISLPDSWSVKALERALVEARAERRWLTPPDGPGPDERLSPNELADLLQGGPRRRYPKGHWQDEENVLPGLAEYIELDEGKEDLRQKHYQAVSRGHPRWPPASAVAKLGRFQEMLQRARGWSRRQGLRARATDPSRAAPPRRWHGSDGAALRLAR